MALDSYSETKHPDGYKQRFYRLPIMIQPNLCNPKKIVHFRLAQFIILCTLEMVGMFGGSLLGLQGLGFTLLEKFGSTKHWFWFFGVAITLGVLNGLSHYMEFCKKTTNSK
jgi:uncharacterized membrane protein